MSTTNLSKIVKDLDLAKNIQTFNQLLDTPPKPEWVKKNPFVKQRGEALEYIPVSIYRKLLRDIFQHFNIEVLDSKVVFNAVQVTVRVHYMHPVSGEWRFVDGIGAMALQTEKGAKAMDAQSLRSDAVQKAAPAAKSYALKNALSELGDIFGGGLNSDVVYDLEDPYEEPKPELTSDEAMAKLNEVTDLEGLQGLYDRLVEEFTITPDIDKLFKAKYEVFALKNNMPKKENPSPAEPPQPKAAAAAPTTEKQSDEQIIRDALSGVKSKEFVNDVFNTLKKQGVDVKSHMNLFSDKYKELSNEAA